MRVIIFRGRRLDNNQWVEGHYVTVEDCETGELQAAIIPLDYGILSDGEIQAYDFVDPATVSEWTGLTDHFGTKVFEGDILASIIRRAGEGPTVFIRVKDIRMLSNQMPLYVQDYEVFGNIWDNPELLVGKE